MFGKEIGKFPGNAESAHADAPEDIWDTAALAKKINVDVSELSKEQVGLLGLYLKISDRQGRQYQALPAGAFSADEKTAMDEHNVQVRAARLKVKITDRLQQDVPDNVARLVYTEVPHLVDVTAFQVLVQPKPIPGL